jgi:iron complex outermembrane receptor protein
VKTKKDNQRRGVHASTTLALLLTCQHPLAAEAEAEKSQDQTPAETSDEVTILPEMTITAPAVRPGETGYNVYQATTATKTDAPIMETPVNIQVVPPQVLRDQQAFRLEQALWNVSGVYMEPLGTFQGSGEIFSVRGFSTQTTYRNGFRLQNVFSGTGPLETANLDRIEVLKGPAAILFGRIEPGGLINLVPKQPLADPYYSLQQQIGSFDFYRTTLDATGPITQDDGTALEHRPGYAGHLRAAIQAQPRSPPRRHSGHRKTTRRTAARAQSGRAVEPG